MVVAIFPGHGEALQTVAVFRRQSAATYALGRSLSLGDLEAVDALVPILKKRGDGLAALIELVVASEPFQTK